MTAAKTTLPSVAKNADSRVTRPNDTVRNLIAGGVLLAVAVGSLLGVVTDRSQVPTSGFVGAHYLQLIFAVLGCALVIGAIVKSRKNR